MVYFDVTASTVSVTADQEEEAIAAGSILAEALKSKNPQAHMINERITKWGTPVPYYHVAYDLITRTFPRGLLQRAAIALSQAGFKFQVARVDRGDWPKLRKEDVHWSGYAPRDYQLAAVHSWIEAEFGLVVVPTRGGKTLIGGLAASAAGDSIPIVWLVTKLEAQADVVTTWKEQFGKAATTDVAPEGLSVVTYATATKRDLSHIGMVIADEVHRAAADTYYEAIQGATNAWYRLGLTGTPEGRSDGKDIFIEGGIGPACFTIPRSLLIERGLCSSGLTLRVVLDEELEIPDGFGNWASIEKHGIVENATRDMMLLQAAKYARGETRDQVLVLCRRQAHAEALAERASALFGVKVPAMHSKATKKARGKVYRAFAAGEIPVVVATGIYDDSMTFPHLKILVNAAGGKSDILTGQRLGRALAGNKTVTIIDCSDEHYKTLKNHAKKRFRVYEKEGYPVTDWRPTP